MKKVSISEQTVVIPTYPAGEPEKNPLFIEKRAYQGSTGKVYPVPIIETVGDRKEDREYRAVVLENDYLYVMILPELGGRIQRALDKTNGYDFVYYNRVIKPALVGLAGPWISGGIEFNWPQHHRPSTFMPVEHTLRENPDGSATAVLAERDRINGTRACTFITLYPDRAYIEIRGQLYNPTDYPQTFLWWANPAVSVNDSTYSVFPPDVHAVMDHGRRAVSTFPIATGEYYKADYSAGVDISRYRNIRVPTSYMADHSDFDFVGNFDEDRDAGLLHVADHHISPGKKQWTWGCGNFGKTWDKNLTDEDGPYIELMTGVYCDNQPDFAWLKPHEEKSFVQYFMPYKTVGRVCNATKDAAVGVLFLDAEGNTLEAGPFEYGREANARIRKQAAKCLVRVYATGEYPGAAVQVTAGGETVFRQEANLTPRQAFTAETPVLPEDFRLEVRGADGELLCEYTEYVREEQPVPKPADPLKKPEEIGSLEELYLAGLHLEQYRHATFLPMDYYLEGLRRDPTDLRLNNACGLYLLRNGNIAESIPYFRRAVKKQTWRNGNPYSGEPYFNLGVALELQGKAEEACDAFWKATWNAETAGAAYYRLACIRMKQGRRKEAEELIGESLRRNSRDLKALALKAAVCAGERTEAEDPLYAGILYRQEEKEACRKALDGRTENYLNLAYELMESGSWREAAEVLEACPGKSPLVYYAKAYAEGQAGNTEAAGADAAKGEGLPTDYCFPNRTEEQLILEYAIRLLDRAPRARYYLGELLYDRKQYAAAAEQWQEAARLEPTLAPAHRNLSIANWNHGDRKSAEAEIAEACRLEPGNSRFLLEQDQLLKRTGRTAEERLAILEAKKELLPERYALMLAYISLLNATGRHREALELLEGYTFHVWEGGEGKVAAEYRTALWALAEEALEAEKPEQALDYAMRSTVYPDNLGEGKLDDVPDNRAYFLAGKAYRMAGEEEKARTAFREASKGKRVPETVRYYNDQPSDYIYWQGLAFRELGDEENAEACFRAILEFGEAHLQDKAEYDFFAVSMPELEVYQDDIQQRSDDYCRELIRLGKAGLRE